MEEWLKKLNEKMDAIVSKYLYGKSEELAEPPCESLVEMAKLCDKVKDGYGFYIYVKNSGPGGARSEHLPMHAHVFTQLNPDIDIGSFDITSETLPASVDDIIDVNKKRLLPTDVKHKIVEWARKKHKNAPLMTNWAMARTYFMGLNPSLFP